MLFQELRGDFFFSDEVPENFGVDFVQTLSAGYLGLLALEGLDKVAKVSFKVLSDDVLYVEWVRQAQGVLINIAGEEWRDGVVRKAIDSHYPKNIWISMHSGSGLGVFVVRTDHEYEVGDKIAIR